MKFDHVVSVVIVIGGAAIGQALITRFPAFAKLPLLALAAGIGLSFMLSAVISLLAKPEP